MFENIIIIIVVSVVFKDTNRCLITFNGVNYNACCYSFQNAFVGIVDLSFIEPIYKSHDLT